MTVFFLGFLGFSWVKTQEKPGNAISCSCSWGPRKLHFLLLSWVWVKVMNISCLVLGQTGNLATLVTYPSNGHHLFVVWLFFSPTLRDQHDCFKWKYSRGSLFDLSIPFHFFSRILKVLFKIMGRSCVKINMPCEDSN